jgi:hypothetical protein
MTRKEFLRFIAEAGAALDPPVPPSAPRDDPPADRADPAQKSKPAESDSVR